MEFRFDRVLWTAAAAANHFLPQVRGRDRLLSLITPSGEPPASRVSLSLGIEIDTELVAPVFRREIAFLRYAQPALSPVLQVFLRPGDCFFDVGANVGFYSLIAASLVGSTGLVHAFEPVPFTCESFCRLVDFNRLSNVRINQVAVGASAGHVVMDFDLHAPGLAHVRRNGGKDASLPFVDLVTLDTYVQNSGVPRLVKVDVEGYEEQVIVGSQHLLSEHHPGLLLEMDPLLRQRAGTEHRRLMDRLKALGYAALSLTERGLRETDVPSSQNMLFAHPTLHAEEIDRLSRKRFARNQNL